MKEIRLKPARHTCRMLQVRFEFLLEGNDEL